MRKILLFLSLFLITSYWLFGMIKNDFKPSPITISDLKKGEESTLPNEYIPGSSAGAYRYDKIWRYFSKTNVQENFLIKNYKKAEQSKFFNFPIYYWAVYEKELLVPIEEEDESFIKKQADNISSFVLRLASSNTAYTKELKDFNRFSKIYAKPGSKKQVKFEEMNESQVVTLRKEIIKGLAYRYKLHLQIKPEYLVWFVNDFEKFITNDPRCKNIESFKAAARGNIENFQKKEDPLATIVVYIVLVKPKDRYKVIKPILQAILERYKNVSKEIDFGVVPRFSKKIKDFIYISGGDGDTKKAFKAKKIENKIYTDDYAFFKGYEIKPEKILKKNRNLLKSLWRKKSNKV